MVALKINQRQSIEKLQQMFKFRLMLKLKSHYIHLEPKAKQT